MARRPIALAAGILLLAEAAGLLFVHAVLASVVTNQNMSFGGFDPGLTADATWAMGGVFAAALACCAALLVLMAVRDRVPGRPTRIALVACAIAHGVLGALAVGLVGWTAFGFLMVVLGLIVGSLLLYAPDPAAPAPG
ncbi:hypothetical protein NX801_02645 [Streptomyces sp. LP05-1]|uniref:Integral membrane protein n=1 Tax=Streptomyces pyxinae TaxID=2970734 RepID=A0ABT2CAZ9_9ACTN|nr:hypothetical protein [Streptomyces sp. LP05-1]